MKEVLNLTFASSLDGLVELNSSFDSGKLRVAYTGPNRNKSCIEKSVFENAIPSLHGVPVVCNYNVQSDTIGGHDMGIITSENGDIRLINLTEPVGFVPESADYWFENVTEEDGSVHEYLCVDVLLWKRQAAYKHIKENGITAHSMEISVKDGEQKDGLYNIYDFEFSALCLLGDVEPCFESSALETYSNMNFSAEMAEMMAEAKKVFSTIGTTSVVDNIHPQKISEEGGEIALEDNIQNVEEQNIDNEPVVEDEQLEFAAEQVAEVEQENDEPEEVENEPEQSSNFELNSNITDGFYEALSGEKYVDRWGDSWNRYHYVDCDLEKSEVYCYDHADGNLYGFNFNFNNDAIEINFDSKRRMKWAIVEFNGAEQAPILGTLFSEYDKKLEEYSDMSQKYSESESRVSILTEELDELREFKANTEKADYEAKRNDLFSMFEDLTGNEAFEAIKEDHELALDVIEEKCFAIRGRIASQAKFSFENNKPTKIKIEQPSNIDDTPYGGVVEKYLGKID